jgi:hypothetical protein
MATRHTKVIALAVAGGAWLCGCGSESTQAPSGASMAAAAGTATARPASSANGAPQISSVTLEPTDPQPGTVVRALAHASDPDGDSVQIRYEWRIAGSRVAGGRDGSLVVPELPKGENLVVDAIASDGRAESEAASAQVRVGNRPPAVTDVRFDPSDDLKPGQTLIAVAEGTDPDDDQIDFRYEWRVGNTVQRETGERFDTAELKRGDRISVRVVATDGDDDSQPVESRFIALGNSAPKVVSLPPSTMSADGVFVYGVETEDPDGDRNLRFRLGTAPEGARVDPLLGEVTWKPTLEQQGKHPIEVIVSDGHGGETNQVFEVEVKEVIVKAGIDTPPAKRAP